ncbi:MAG: tRNA dihydrouridine synthase DusB [Ruminococcaceae bacterium]|nr:tRNA dihydrouridine synthase DusB [Oscillospiraceae bacterium]
MKIGNVTVNGFAALAPMAGVADMAMREICEKYGAAYSVGELTSAKAITLGDKKSPEFLSRGNLACFGNQLFGCEPEIMAKAAKVAESFAPDFIDINMGCPAPKVANNGGGSSLMKDPKLACEIVKAVVNSVKVPVTVKIRAGWDENSLNAVELAKICEANGASAITVHGRTRAQMYAPPVNLDIIKEVKKAVNIAVIGNGDITDGPSAAYMYEYTGCDFVMVGRAANGTPWVFDKINAYLKNGEILEDPPLEKRLEILMEQLSLMQKYKSERTVLLEARKHAAWYMKGVRNAAALRKMCGEINSFSDIALICEKALAEGEDM